MADRSYEEVVAELVELHDLEKNLQFRIGDTVKDLRGDFGKLAAVSGFGQRRLQVSAQVAAAFDQEVRDDHATLGFSFYRAVAHLPREEAIRLLDQAVDDDLSLERFGRLVAGKPDPELCTCEACGRSHRKAAE